MAKRDIVYGCRIGGRDEMLKQFNSNPDLIPVGNRLVIDLKTGIPRERRMDDYFTYQCDITYDPHNTNREVERMVRRIFSYVGSDIIQNEEDRVVNKDNDELDYPDEFFHFIHKCLGYSLTGYRRERKLFLLQGDDGNGASTFMKIMEKVLGPCFAKLPPMDDLKTVKYVIDNATHCRFFSTGKIEPPKHMSKLSVVSLFKELYEIGQYKIWSLVPRDYEANEMKISQFRGHVQSKIVVQIKMPSKFLTSRQIMELPDSSEEIQEDFDGPKYLYRAIPDIIDRLDDQEVMSGFLNFLIQGAKYWYEEGLGECPSNSHASYIKSTNFNEPSDQND